MRALLMTAKKKGGWQPGANTLFYYPLQNDTTDVIGNTSLTGGTYTQQSIGYLCAGNTVSVMNTISASSAIKSSLKTLLSWVYVVDKGPTSGSNWTQILFMPNGNTCYAFYMSGLGSNIFFSRDSGVVNHTASASLPTGSWHLLGLTVSSSGSYGYIDGVETTIFSTGSWWTGSTENIILGRSGTEVIHSNIIGEDRTWTAQEILDYYNATKDNYPQNRNSNNVEENYIKIEPTEDIHITPNENDNGSGDLQKF